MQTEPTETKSILVVGRENTQHNLCFSLPMLRRYLYAGLTVLIVFLVVRWLLAPVPVAIDERLGYRGQHLEPVMGRQPDRNDLAPARPVANTVSLEVYMESQCPDTSRFVKQQLVPAWNLLSRSGRVDLTLIPFGKAACTPHGGDFQCTCQHGAAECQLNQLMNCVIDQIGYPERYVPVVACIQGKGSLDSAVGACVSSTLGPYASQIVECAQGPRGRGLLARAGARTAALEPRLNFVPWIVVNGERNSDALYDLSENLCKVMHPAPKECEEILSKLDDRK